LLARIRNWCGRYLFW